MPKFKYIAMDGQGKEKKGSVVADNEQTAAAKLKQQGLFPTSIHKLEENARKKKKAVKAPGEKKKPFILGTPKIKGKDLTIFTRQLATLIDAGLPLLRALKTLERQSSKKPAQEIVVTDICNSVEGGATFADALGNHPKSFDRLYVNMVRSGEAAGNLEEVLGRLADFKEKSARIAGKIKSASMYPIIVLVIAMAITAGLMIFIVPKFQQIFNDMLGKDEPMPMLTQLVIQASEFMQNHFMILLGIIIAIIIVFKLLKSTPKGEYLLHLASVKLPPFNNLVIKSNVSQFARTLGTLQKSGVSILQALKIVHDTTNNQVLATAIDKIKAEVTEGEPLVKPMSASKVFPDMVISMVEVGEETGELPDMLERVANTYDEEVDNAVEGLISLIEPLLIVFLALVVGTIVIAMFLPLVKLIENLGG